MASYKRQISCDNSLLLSLKKLLKERKMNLKIISQRLKIILGGRYYSLRDQPLMADGNAYSYAVREMFSMQPIRRSMIKFRGSRLYRGCPAFLSWELAAPETKPWKLPRSHFKDYEKEYAVIDTWTMHADAIIVSTCSHRR